MKQVWQATDNTIFEKELDCESYESKLAFKEGLAEAIRQEWTEQDVAICINLITKLVRIGEQDKIFKIERGTNGSTIFLLPTICTDVRENKPNLCIAFLGLQLTISWEIGE